MKPINYDEIFEKAEARRAALEAITPKLQAIYDLWDTLYAATRPINSVNADFEQLDLEAAALLAQSVGVSVSTLGCGLHYLANVMQMLDRPSKDLLEALKPNEEARHLTPLSEQAAPKAAPGEPTDSDGFGSAEHWKEKAQYWAGVAHRLRGEALRGEPVDGIVQPPAPQQEAQEPTEISEAIERMAADRYKVVSSHESMFYGWAVVAGTGTQQLYVGREVECRNLARRFAGAFLDGAFVAMQQAAPQQEAQALSDDTKRLDWMDKDAGERVFHVGADWYTRPTYGQPYRKHKNLRAAIDAALAAQGGKDA